MKRTKVARLSRAAFSLLLLAGFGLFFRPLPAQAQGQKADMILHNGKVLTVDNNFTITQAVAIAGNKILATGSDADIMKLAGPNAQVIDLKGRTVIPGLADTHRHSYNYAESTYGGLFKDSDLHRYPIDWRGVRSKEDVLNEIKNIMAEYKFKPGEWIYFENQLQFFTREGGTKEQAKILYDELNQWELDKVTPNNPIAMSLGIPDFNGFLVNKKAMDYLFGKYGDYIKKNGRFWVDATGRPDGHLEPPASRLVLPFTYDRSPEVLSVLYKNQAQEENAMGMTQVTGRLPEDTVAAYKLLESKGELTQRMGYGMI